MDTQVQVTHRANLNETTHDLLELVRPGVRMNSTTALMLLTAITAGTCITVLTVPGLLFNQPSDNVYSHFSRILAFDQASFLPLTLTGLASALALLLPLPRRRTLRPARSH
jgi:hypothetical protein